MKLNDEEPLFSATHLVDFTYKCEEREGPPDGKIHKCKWTRGNT